MRTRAITGFFFVIALVGAILGGSYTFTLLFSLISLFSLLEFYKIIQKKHPANIPIGIILGVGILSIYGLLSFEAENIYVLCLPFICIIALFLGELYHKTNQAFIRIAFSITGVIYTILPFICFMQLGFLNTAFSPTIPLGFLILLWSNDTGAYLSGKFLGKHKLFERHSPNKTWEGFFGGITLALISAYILAQYASILPLHIWLISASIIGVFGTYGDLIESMLKRSYGIKDSGHILPGHGGLLDRFDGLLLAAPILYLFLKLVA